MAAHKVEWCDFFLMCACDGFSPRALVLPVGKEIVLRTLMLE